MANHRHETCAILVEDLHPLASAVVVEVLAMRAIAMGNSLTLNSGEQMILRRHPRRWQEWFTPRRSSVAEPILNLCSRLKVLKRFARGEVHKTKPLRSCAISYETQRQTVRSS